jgi:flagellar biosynthesis chaperone FliJ
MPLFSKYNGYSGPYADQAALYDAEQKRLAAAATATTPSRTMTDSGALTGQTAIPRPATIPNPDVRAFENTATTASTQAADALIQQATQAGSQAGVLAQQRGDDLYNVLLQRANQSLTINRDDPVIRAQSDAYSAAQERARRDALADLAEKAGPNANLRGETRLGYEQMGQNVGAFEAQLIASELQTRRDEIAQTLQIMAGYISDEQKNALQMQLAALDAAIQQQKATLDSRALDLQYDAIRRGIYPGQSKD